MKANGLRMIVAAALALCGLVLAATSIAAPKVEPQTMLARPAPIIANHTSTNLSDVPAYWIEQAKARFRIFYAHTSHGSQIVDGADVLMSLTPSGLYNLNHDGAVEPGMLSFDDHYDDLGDLGGGGDLTWAAVTRDYLDNHPGVNVVMWSWCAGVSDNTEEGIAAYLTEMTELEGEYPGVTFIYMTGHLDGSGVEGNLNVRNEQIRAYVRAHNGVLFDFADIESYNPSGEYFLDRGAADTCDYDNGNWAIEWCSAHSSDPLCASCECAHSEPLNCNLKARAFWWLLARLAGWGGVSDGGPRHTASITTPVFNQVVTYTIVVQGLNAPYTATVYLTNTLGGGITYIFNTLTATQGTVNAAAPSLYWTGSLSDTHVVTITYAVTVTAAAPTAISNTATIVAPGYQTLDVIATIIANGYSIYLPLVVRQ